MTEPICICGHEKSNGRCWRLTCPTNGAQESAELARPGEFYRGNKTDEGKLL
jgi:hypothetical protein